MFWAWEPTRGIILVIFFSFLTLLSYTCSECEKKKRDAPDLVDGGGMTTDGWYY